MKSVHINLLWYLMFNLTLYTYRYRSIIFNGNQYGYCIHGFMRLLSQNLIQIRYRLLETRQSSGGLSFGLASSVHGYGVILKTLCWMFRSITINNLGIRLYIDGYYFLTTTPPLPSVKNEMSGGCWANSTLAVQQVGSVINARAGW